MSARAWVRRQQVYAAAKLFGRGRLRSEIAVDLGITAIEAGVLIREAAALGLIENAKVVRATKRRPCLTCGRRFHSSGNGHRLCDRCREHAAALPQGWT